MNVQNVWILLGLQSGLPTPPFTCPLFKIKMTRERSCAGELMTDSGSVNLQRNTVAFMKRDEVEPLIRQGVLEQLQTSVQ